MWDLFNLFATQSIGLLTGTSLTLVLGFVQWYLKRKDEQARQKIPKVLQSIKHIYETLNNILNHTNATRVAVCKLTNGGNIPRVGTPLYSTIMYEVIGQDGEFRSDEWQRRLINEELTNILVQTTIDSTVIVKNAHNQGIVRETFDRDGIKSLVFVEVGKQESEYYYLLLAYTDDKIFTRPESKPFVKGAAAKIRHYLNL